MRILSLLVALLALLVAAPAHAQFGPFGPGGIVVSSQSVGQAQVTTPTGAAQTLLTQDIGFGVLGSPFSFHGRGTLDTQAASPGTLTLTVKLGTGAAMTVINGVTLDSNNTGVPFWLDCDFNQANTGTTPKALGSATTMVQQCVFSWMPTGAGTASKVFAPLPTQPTISLTTNITLLVGVTFSNTTAGTGITMRDWRVVYGG